MPVAMSSGSVILFDTVWPMLVAKTLPDTVKALLFHARRNVALFGYIVRHSLVDVANALLFHFGFTPRSFSMLLAPCLELHHTRGFRQ